MDRKRLTYSTDLTSWLALVGRESDPPTSGGTDLLQHIDTIYLVLERLKQIMALLLSIDRSNLSPSFAWPLRLSSSTLVIPSLETISHLKCTIQLVHSIADPLCRIFYIYRWITCNNKIIFFKQLVLSYCINWNRFLLTFNVLKKK